MIEEFEYIQSLKDSFKVDFSLEPTDERILYLNFEDGRKFRLQHPGALQIAKIFSKETDSLSSDALEYFLNNCIDPVAGTQTKALNEETLGLNETMDFWLPFAWRWLRYGLSIIVK